MRSDGTAGKKKMIDNTDSLWSIVVADDPIVATAIHDGHEVREEVASLLALPEADRRREEDPFSAVWTEVAPTRIVAHRSRFEVDLNRPREKAVYINPEDAWGLRVWKSPPPHALVERSLAEYDAFYSKTNDILSNLVQRQGAVVVLDLHTYNHRRSGPAGAPANPEENPEVNICTGSLDRKRFGMVADRFTADLKDHDFMGRQLDVRENVKFKGGQFSRWIHERFGGSVCSLAVEFKKFFMDEWTGELFEVPHQEIRMALAATLPGLREVLQGVRPA